MEDPSLNRKIEEAWLKVRDGEAGLSVAERRTYRTRFSHIIADHLDTTLERVRQRIVKLEKKLESAANDDT